MLKIWVLDALRLEVDGKEHPPPSSERAQLLLAMLAVERKKHARTELARRLWPHVASGDARNQSLRNELSHVRKALGNAARFVPIAPKSKFVELTGTHEDVWTDVGELTELLDDGKLPEALELWDGQEFLAGLEHDWVAERHEFLRQRLCRKLAAAAADAQKRGDLESAVRWSRHHVKLEPTEEEAHRKLMRLLLDADDRGAALKVYEALEQHLRTKHGAPPSEHTRKLAEEAREDHESPPVAPNVKQPPTTPPPQQPLGENNDRTDDIPPGAPPSEPSPRGPERRWRRIAIVAGALVAIVAIAVALGVLPSGGAVADPAWLDEPPRGHVSYCTGTDVSFTHRRSVADFNDFIRSDKRGTARARLVELSPKANEQRDQYRERIADGSCDVVFLDVIYGPEFAADDLLYDLSDYIEEREEGGAPFHDGMLDTVGYDGRRWGVPKQLDGGVLYYRRDQVRPQSTWRRLLRAAAGRQLLRLQLDAYEGATVAFLELAHAAGADAIVADGTARLVQDGTRTALEFLLEAIRLKALPESVVDQEEKGSLYVYEIGNAKYLRSWPYVARRIKRDALDPINEQDAARRRVVVEHTRVAPLPRWDSDSPRRVGILGGHNLVIPRSAPNPQAALHLVRFLTTRDQMLRDARGGSLMPAREDLWSRPAVRSRPELEAVTQLDLQARPILPCYYALSEVIYTRVRALTTAPEALTTASDDVDGVLEDMQTAAQAVLDDGC